MSCCEDHQADLNLTQKTIEHIQHEYSRNSLPWSLGFSGGKDSSALLKVVYIALSNMRTKSKPVTVVYCDTGVEIPVVHSFVHETLSGLSREAKESGVPLETQILCPPIQDRYFSKVIGRGYPPPSYRFRWCTDVLRINPVKHFLAGTQKRGVILLGIRRGESTERDRVLLRHKTHDEYYFRQSNNTNVTIYSPLIEYRARDIWSLIAENSQPRSIDAERLKTLYGVLNPNRSENGILPDLPNTRGRFGCWTCTVVREDRAVQNLVRAGYQSLQPMLEFRNWLLTIRSDPAYRHEFRRNGDKGPGPFTLEARKEILQKLLEVQGRVEVNLISTAEIDYIERQWDIDRHESQRHLAFENRRCTL